MRRSFYDSIFKPYGGHRHDSMGWCSGDYFINLDGEQMNHEYIYTPTGTDITVRWRLQGWIPPSEQQEYLEKWKYYQELPLRKLDDAAKKEYEAVLKKAKVARVR
jgi:hypothetical protein